VRAACLMLLFSLPALAAPTGAGASDFPGITNLSQLRLSAAENIRVVRSFRLIVEVIDVDPAAGVLAVRDSSGTEFLRVEGSDRNIHPGATLSIEGKGCGLKLERFGIAIIPGMVVDNDGIHPQVTESGRRHLRRGLNPIKLAWFNWFGDQGLSVEYEGPNIRRQTIPGSVLIKKKTEAAATNLSHGLNYRCYEGTWDLLPDFRKLQPVQVGVATHFDVAVRTRTDAVGMEFDGFIMVPEDGEYTFYVSSDDGARLYVGEASLVLRVLHQGNSRVETDVEKHAPKGDRRWVVLEGVAGSAGIWGAGGELRLRVGDDDIRVELFRGGHLVPDLTSCRRVQVSGLYEDVLNQDGELGPGRVLALSWKSVKPAEGDTDRGGSADLANSENASASSPARLTTAAEIKALSSKRASQRIPVLIRGVVTAFSSKNSGAVIQDATRGVFVDVFRWRGAEPLQRGQLCEIEGVTDPGGFSPVVVAHRIRHLGPGKLPKPVRATWDQLVNGSLDTEFAEIDGVVTEVKGSQLLLLTEGGKISVDLKDFRPEALLAFENALVRLRGCFLVNFNFGTRRLETGSLVISGADVELLELPPADPFETPRRSIGELLFYDAKAAPFRRVKIGGQVIYSRAGECFLTDGTNSVQVKGRSADIFAVGDLVDAVGFLQLGGNAPELRQAVMRKTGHAALRDPRKLPADELFLARNSGGLVEVDATLINHWRDASEQVLELQSGFLAFKARLHKAGPPLSLPPLGSRLALIGAYAPHGNATGDGSVSGFDLLLSSAKGIRVLATPPWWTLKRVLILAGILAAILFGVLIWNKELHSKVEERGRLLEAEIHNRQRAEMQHAAEADRARIARDLHDELGTGLTEVSLLASAGLGQYHDGEKIRSRFHNIAEKARELVSSLDFIVWAIDSRRNSLQSFADYLGHYSRELMGSAGIDCRLRIRMERGEISLTEAERHSLFLAVKEALNNVIRHASATQVEVQVSQAGDRMSIVMTDDGRGFNWDTIQRGDGITNLQERLQAMQGECRFDSHPGKGTTVTFIVPVTQEPHRTSSEIT